MLGLYKILSKFSRLEYRGLAHQHPAGRISAGSGLLLTAQDSIRKRDSLENCGQRYAIQLRLVFNKG